MGMSASLRISGLSLETTERYLYAHFSKFPGVEIESVRVCRDPTTRNSLGSAYINFVSERSLEVVRDLLRRGMRVRNGQARVACRGTKRARGDKDDVAIEGRNLVVTNIPRQIATLSDIEREVERGCSNDQHYSFARTNMFGEGARRIAYLLCRNSDQAAELLAAYRGPLQIRLHAPRER